MSRVDLETVKAGVLATGFTDDDVLLQQLTDAAEAVVASYLRRDLSVDFPGDLPADIQQAVIMLVFHFYEASPDADKSASEVWPFGVRLLLNPHRNLS